MAYLKGGSIIDGNLYVEGGLRVKRITDSSGGKIPSILGEIKANRIIKFASTAGDDAPLSISSITETFDDTTPVFSIENTTNNKFSINLNSIKFATITLSAYSKGSVSDSGGLLISTNTSTIGDDSNKDFILRPSYSILPYSVDQIYASKSSNLIGVDSSGTPVGDDVVPERFAYGQN